jgi:hypothetical protein
MWRSSLRFVVPLLLTFVALPNAQAQTSDPRRENWRTFLVPDFGTRVEYPTGIFSLPEGKAEKGIGERFTTEDGRAVLSIYSQENDNADTPASYLRRNLRFPRSALEYQRVTASFFAISAVSQGTTYYSRCNFSSGPGGAIHCFDIAYPQPEERAWDKIVTRISLSLRPLEVVTR